VTGKIQAETAPDFM
ncbi:unnamed protein product, partial [Rotaria sp. Silwood1]